MHGGGARPEKSAVVGRGEENLSRVRWVEVAHGGIMRVWKRGKNGRIPVESENHVIDENRIKPVSSARKAV